MTASISTQDKKTVPSTLLHTLTLVFALLTLFTAMISMILESRRSTLQTDFLISVKEAASSETASIHAVETALKTATEKLETVQKNLNEEKAAADGLRRQLAGAMKELEKARIDLTSANQTISKLKSTAPGQASPVAETPEPITTPVNAPSTETVSAPPAPAPSALPPNQSSVAIPATVQPPAVTPAAAVPEASTKEAPALPDVKPEKQAGTTTSPATAPLPSPSGSSVREETIPDSPMAPPPATVAPAAE